MSSKIVQSRERYAQEPQRELIERKIDDKYQLILPPSLKREPLQFGRSLLDKFKTIPERDKRMILLQAYDQCPSVNLDHVEILLKATPKEDVPKLIEALKQTSPARLNSVAFILNNIIVTNINFPLSLILLNRANLGLYEKHDHLQNEAQKIVEWIKLSNLSPSYALIIPLLFNPSPTPSNIEKDDRKLLEWLQKTPFLIDIDPAILEKSNPLLNKCEYRPEKLNIIFTLACLPMAQQETSIKQIEMMLTEQPNHLGVAYMLEIFKRIPVEQRTDEVLKNIAIFFAPFQEGEDKHLFEFLFAIPQHDYPQLMQIAPLITEGTPTEKLRILFLLSTIFLPEQRNSLAIEAVKPIVSIQGVAELFYWFEKADRPAALNHIKRLAALCEDEEDEEVLERYVHLSKEERSRVMESENPLNEIFALPEKPKDHQVLLASQLLDQIPYNRQTPQVKEDIEKIVKQQGFENILFLLEILGNLGVRIDPNRLVLTLESYQENYSLQYFKYFTGLYHFIRDRALSESEIERVIDFLSGNPDIFLVIKMTEMSTPENKQKYIAALLNPANDLQKEWKKICEELSPSIPARFLARGGIGTPFADIP
jgi:hypothetical protein